jgi:N-acetylglutamate synthase-like GNAT family acetyltransferase
MQISRLIDQPQFIETLAPWIWEHWRPILTEDTLQDRIAKLQSHLNSNTLPMAWVAHDGSNALGTAALRVHDLPGREDLTPWLGGVFVDPQFRHQGIGTELCKVVAQNAVTLFGIETLYLFTLDQQAWYESLGWKLKEPCSWCGQPGAIMFKRYD